MQTPCKQTTLKSPVSFTGKGLHTGRDAQLTLRPAFAEHGIWFLRTDIRTGDRLIPARYDCVTPVPLCTRVENAQGVDVATIEHLMAALAGCGVHNALIEIDGPEVPILDGSAAPFVRAIMQAGLRQLPASVRALRVRQPVVVQYKDAQAALMPASSLQIEFYIDFEDHAIGCQSKALDLSNGAFVRELCDSRTFCRQADVGRMRAQGLALGGKPGENAVVFDDARVTSPGGLRHRDEPVRHKMLDALGDLALAGAPLIGRYRGHKAGHNLTNEVLRKLFATPGAVEMVECDSETAARLPGVGLTMHEIPAVA